MFYVVSRMNYSYDGAERENTSIELPDASSVRCTNADEIARHKGKVLLIEVLAAAIFYYVRRVILY